MPSLPGVVFVQFGELWNANWRMTEQMRDSSVRSAQLRSDNAHFCEGKFFVLDRAKDKTDASSLCVAQLDASDVFRRLYFVSRYTHCIRVCILAYTSGHCNRHSANLTLQQFGNRSRWKLRHLQTSPKSARGNQTLLKLPLLRWHRPHSLRPSGPSIFWQINCLTKQQFAAALRAIKSRKLSTKMCA